MNNCSEEQHFHIFPALQELLISRSDSLFTFIRIWSYQVLKRHPFTKNWMEIPCLHKPANSQDNLLKDHTASITAEGEDHSVLSPALSKTNSNKPPKCYQPALQQEKHSLNTTLKIILYADKLNPKPCLRFPTHAELTPASKHWCPQARTGALVETQTSAEVSYYTEHGL